MPQTNDEIEALVQDLVAKDKLSKAIDLLREHFKEVDDQPRHQVILKLSAQTKTIEKRLQLSEITQEDANVGMSKIMDATLNIFSVDPSLQFEANVSKTEDKFGERIIQIASLIIILFLLIGIIASVVTQGVDPIIKAVEASLFVVGASMVAFGLLFMVKKYILT